MNQRSSLNLANVFSQNASSPPPAAAPATTPPPFASADSGASGTSDASENVPTSTTPTTSPAPAKPAPKQQVNFYADAEAYGAFKRAHRATLIHTDFTSISAHLNDMLVREVQRLEQEYNGGAPFGS